jgi:hypothetical protein
MISMLLAVLWLCSGWLAYHAVEVGKLNAWTGRWYEIAQPDSGQGDHREVESVDVSPVLCHVT